MAESKRATSIRLSEEGRRLLERLAENLGVSQAAVMELSLRRLARTELPQDGKPEEEPPVKKRRKGK